MISPLRLVLLGPPASGKGTLAELIHQKWMIPITSTGSIIRKEIEQKTAYGEQVAHAIAEGKLAPDPLVMTLVTRWLDALQQESFLFDGFPRTIPQAELLDALLKEREQSLKAVIWLELDRSTIEERTLARRVCRACRRAVSLGLHVQSEEESCPSCGGELFQRADDSIEVLNRRMSIYEEHTLPLKSYYQAQGILEIIDASRPREEVMSEISDLLEQERVS
ncbi:MAG: adenylate kinase family protein [Verrucomicrobiales bacterium]